jgi:signal transduction histidine kinase/CheY-like chemotaxis protein
MAHILVVDDRPMNREFLLVLLGYHGHTCDVADDGVLAMERVHACRPDLVITDLLMPNMGGEEFTRLLRADPTTKDLPVIFYTATYRGREAREIADRVGVRQVLAKPSEPGEIVAAVDLALGASAAAAPGGAPGERAAPAGPAGAPGKGVIEQLNAVESLNLRLAQLLQNAVQVAEEQALSLTEVRRLEHALQNVQSLSLRLTGLVELGLELSRTRDLRELSELFNRALQDILSAHYAGVVLLGGEGETLRQFTACGLEDATRARVAAGIRDCPLAREVLSVGAAGRVVTGVDTVRVGGLPDSHPPVRNVLACALVARGKSIGWLYVADRLGGETFSADDERVLMALAAQFSIAWDGLALYTELERLVAQRTQQLERADRAKSDFLANMSHELRTPLNSIIGFSEMLKDGVLGALDPRQNGFVTDIFEAGSHLLSLINDILDLSKVEAGMLQLEPVPVDVVALLQASMQVVRERAAAHHIRLETRLDAALGTMLTDPRKLKQIVYNLLSNAVKFTPDGGTVTLRAGRCSRAEVLLDEALPGRLIALAPGEDGEFLGITVEDTGVGIAEQQLSRLFEPFTQLDSSIARRQGGTGLGLSIVRRLAELHGGAVGLSSRPGAGSRFCVWLPYRTPDATALPGATLPDAGAPPTPAPPLALVIEDDDRTAGLIEAQLRAEGFEVMRAATAEEGLVRAAKLRPQVITLDIFLPSMDGWEFMRCLRADPRLAATPVVIITLSPDLDRGLALGARRVLHKPIVRAELVAALAGLVDSRSDGAPALVLVVDDNVAAVELVASALEAEGYRVLRAYGGAEAIAVARSAKPDLVILDLLMPEVSGFEVASALRESEHTAAIPILVLTAKDLSAEDRVRLNSNVSAILAKANFSSSELFAEMRRALPRGDGV